MKFRKPTEEEFERIEHLEDHSNTSEYLVAEVDDELVFVRVMGKLGSDAEIDQVVEDILARMPE